MSDAKSLILKMVSYNLATNLSTVRWFKGNSLANSINQSNWKTNVSLWMFQLNPRIFFSLETVSEQPWTPNWVCAYVRSSSDSLTTSSTGTPPSSSIHSISLLELDIHFLKLNPASFLFFILDLAFFVQLKCFRDAVFPLIEVIHIERGQKIAHKLGIISFILGHVVSDCFVGRKGELQDSPSEVLEQKPGKKRLGHNYPAVMRAVPSKEERLHSGLC